MKKYLPHIVTIILFSSLLIVSMLLISSRNKYFNFYEQGLEIVPEIMEFADEGGDHVLDGILIENKIEKEGYIIIRINMARFFVGWSDEMRNVKILVSEDSPAFLINIGIDHLPDGEIKTITQDELKTLDRVRVTLTHSIDKLLEKDELIVINEIAKIVE